MGFSKCCNFSCGPLSLIISIIAGVAVGILFSFGLIPLPINFIIIALIISTIALGTVFSTALVANLSRENYKIIRCLCNNGKCLLIGGIGTLIAGTVSAVIGVTTVTTLSSIFVGLTAFFLILALISFVLLILCLISKNCECC